MFNNNNCGWWYCRQRLWWLDWRRNRQWNRYFNYYNVNRVLEVEVCLEIFSAVSKQSVLIVGWNRSIREKNRPSSESTDLYQVIRKIYHINVYRMHLAPWAGIELTTLVLNFLECIKYNINTIFILWNSLISITSPLYIQSIHVKK